jgi:hypothetical protein
LTPDFPRSKTAHRARKKESEYAVKKPSLCEKSQIHGEETGFLCAVVKFSRSIVKFKQKL